MTWDEARGIAFNIAKLPEAAMKITGQISKAPVGRQADKYKRFAAQCYGWQSSRAAN
jgi:hypothetical protein